MELDSPFHLWLSQRFRPQELQLKEIESLEPKLFLEYCTKVFSGSHLLLGSYSDLEVKEGLYSLISPGFSDDIFALTNEAIPLDSKLSLLRGIIDLNQGCFAPRCTPHLSHLDRKETPPHVSPLNWICYMWWNVFIIYGDRDKASLDPLNRISIGVMEKCLRIPNVAVQEGALHGLGHFALEYPDEAKQVILQ